MMGELMRYLYEQLPMLIASLVGTLGFAMLFKMRGKYLIYISMFGVLSYAVYLAVLFLGYSELLAAFASAATIALLSEIFARVFKAPTVIFTTVGIVPIVPGSALYYSMRNLLLRDLDGFCLFFSGQRIPPRGEGDGRSIFQGAAEETDPDTTAQGPVVLGRKDNAAELVS